MPVRFRDHGPVDSGLPRKVSRLILDIVLFEPVLGNAMVSARGVIQYRKFGDFRFGNHAAPVRTPGYFAVRPVPHWLGTLKKRIRPRPGRCDQTRRMAGRAFGPPTDSPSGRWNTSSVAFSETYPNSPTAFPVFGSCFIVPSFTSQVPTSELETPQAFDRGTHGD